MKYFLHIISRAKQQIGRSRDIDPISELIGIYTSLPRIFHPFLTYRFMSCIESPEEQSFKKIILSFDYNHINITLRVDTSSLIQEYFNWVVRSSGFKYKADSNEGSEINYRLRVYLCHGVNVSLRTHKNSPPNKLQFKAHLQHIVKKAIMALSSIAKQSWGAPYKHVHQLFAAVAARIDYAAIIWHRPADNNRVTTTTQACKLTTIQRLAMKAITGCYKTTQTAAAEIETGLQSSWLRLQGTMRNHTNANTVIKIPAAKMVSRSHADENGTYSSSIQPRKYSSNFHTWQRQSKQSNHTSDHPDGHPK